MRFIPLALSVFSAACFWTACSWTERSMEFTDATVVAGTDGGVALDVQTQSDADSCTVRVQQLSDNNIEDEAPATAKGHVVWTGRGSLEAQDSSPDNEVYYWDGTETVQFTDDDDWQYYPSVGMQGLVVWRLSNLNQDALIQASTDSTELIADQVQARMIQAEGALVVWSAGEATGSVVHLWDGQSKQQISPPGLAADFPALSGEEVAFVGSTSGGFADYELYLYSGGQVTRITDNDLVDEYPHLKNGLLVWTQLSTDGQRAAVMARYSGENVVVSDPDLYCGGGVSDGSQIAFVCGPSYDAMGPQSEIFLRNAQGVVTQLTDDNYQDMGPMIDQGVVVWQRWESVTGLGALGSIMYYNGSSKHLLREFVHAPDDPLLHQRLIFADGVAVWMDFDGEDNEIWAARWVGCD